MVRRLLITLAGVAVVGGSVAATAPAEAAVPPSAGHGAARAGATHQPGGLVRLAPGTRHVKGRNGVTLSTSTNWSGYAAVGTYTSVSANWTEPSVTCPGGDQYSSFWVGIDGFTTASNSVEQTGSEADCNGTKPVYSAWWEMWPKPSMNFKNTVKAGDKFYGAVTWESGNTYQLVLQDLTQKWSQTVTASVKGTMNSSAEVIAEAPCCTSGGGILPLAHFSSVPFTNSLANGQAIGNASNLQEMNMADTSGRLEDTVTSLASGEDFSVNWLASNKPR